MICSLMRASRCAQFNWLRVIGDAPGKGAILSFEAEGMHAHDLATILDREGVAVRAGHHCAQPLMERFGVASTTPRLLRALQHARRSRCADCGRWPRRGRFWVRSWTTSLRELYQEVILDHSRHPRHFGALEHATHKAEGYNPLCGDRVTVYLTLDEDGRIADIRFEGKGCAISQASASLMTDMLTGRTRRRSRKADGRLPASGEGRGCRRTSTSDDRERLDVMAGVSRVSHAGEMRDAWPGTL